MKTVGLEWNSEKRFILRLKKPRFLKAATARLSSNVFQSRHNAYAKKSIEHHSLSFL